MKNKSIVVGFLVVVVVILAIVGIWYFSRPITPKVEKELDQLVIAFDKDIWGIYPKSDDEVVSLSVNWEIFSALTTFTRDGRLIADLADYWFNPDDLTWEIYLKKGIKFHNGSEMTAEDVKFSLIDVPKAIEDFYFGDSVAMIDKVEIVDPYRIRIITKNPHPVLMNELSFIAILSKDYIKSSGYDADPIGTGPYKFIKREEKKEIVLERFEDYYGKKPIAKKVTYKIIPEEEKRIEALINKEVDFAYALTPAKIDRVEKTPGVKVSATPSTGITILGMDNQFKTPGIKLDKNPMSDSRVRKAIAYGIDTKEIINKVYSGKAETATQLAVPESFGYNPDVTMYSYNPDKAKKLLTEAGYSQGFEIELLSPDDERAEIAQIITQQLAEIGLTIKPTILPREKFFDKLDNGEASFFLLIFLEETLDVSSLAMDIFHTPTEEYGIDNLVGYSNPKVDELMEKAMSTLDQKVRKEYAQEIMRITTDDLPYLPLLIPEFLTGVRSDLELSERPAGGVSLDDLSFTE